MTADLRTALALGLALLGYLLMVPTCLGRARAQADEDVRVVAIETAHESTSIDDARGIWSVLRSIAARHGWSLRTAARSYSPRLWAGRTRRPWVLGLSERCARRGGPMSRAACMMLFARVRAVMRGEPCPVDVWGMRSDFDRAQDAGRHFAFVVCSPGERNLFAAEIAP